MPDNPIHIILTVYDPSGTYSQHAGVVMASIFENTHSKVVVHVIHDDTLTKENRQKLIRTAEKYSQGLDLIDITEYIKQLDDKLRKVSEYWTIGALYRIFAPEIMSSVNKVIYLDCDIIVNLDIQELWDIDLEGKSFAGVIDGISKSWPLSFGAVQKKLCGCDLKSYINSGVLVMNFKKIRERGSFSEMTIDWLTHHAHLNVYPDQDAINSIFRGDIKFIPQKFNDANMKPYMPDSIIHCTWRDKPWASCAGYDSDRLYWKMFLRTAWGEGYTADDIIDKAIPLIQKSRFFHRHTNNCAKHFFERAWALLYYRLPLGAMVLVIKDMIYRRKHKLLPTH